MAQGGARARSGPAPDPAALRRDRNNDAAWVTLPAAGRSGDLPSWPLGKQSERETHFWGLLWCKPQAVEWERLDMAIEVALYVRRLCEAEWPGAPVAVGTLVKQLGEQLGLTIPGMRMHRWKIGAVSAPAPVVQLVSAERPTRTSSRERFRTDGSGVA